MKGITEYYIWGSDDKGVLTVKLHGMFDADKQCLSKIVSDFEKKYPSVVYVGLDIALDQTFLLGEKR